MHTVSGASNRALHLVLGSIAAGAAFATRRQSPWRLALALLAGAEIAQGLAQWTTPPGLTPTEDEQIPEAPEQVHGKRINGIQMRWEEHGNRHGSLPVVLVHGMPTSPRVWRYVIPRLVEKGIPCLAWEQVGFGSSLDEGLGRDLSISAQAEYLYAWLKDLDIKRAVFVAHDYGGGVVQRLLVSHPELCRGLVLADCVAYDNWPVLGVRLARAVRGVIGLLPAALVKPLFVAALANLGHDNHARGLASAELHWRPYDSPIGPKAMAHQLRFFRGRDTLALAPELPRLNLSGATRIIWAERDPLEIASGKRLAQDLEAPLQRISGARHFTPEDHPDIIADAVHEVVERARTTLH